MTMQTKRHDTSRNIQADQHEQLNRSLKNRSSHWRYFVKKVFLKILENSQENICTRVSFLIKL